MDEARDHDLITLDYVSTMKLITMACDGHLLPGTSLPVNDPGAVPPAREPEAITARAG